jgi:hypothetical protein
MRADCLLPLLMLMAVPPDAATALPEMVQVQQQGKASLWVEKRLPHPLSLQVLETMMVLVRVDSDEPVDVSEAKELEGKKLFESDTLRELKGVRIQAGLLIEFPKIEPAGVAVKQWRKVYQVTPQRDGQHLLKLPKLQYSAGDDNVELVTWDPVPLRATTRVAKADISEVRDLTAIEDIPPPPVVTTSTTWLWWFALVPVVVILAVVWLWCRRSRRLKELSPRDVVLRHLEELQHQPIDNAIQVERWHTRLSDLLRWYLEKQLNLPATRQTTTEFFLALQRHGKVSLEHQIPLNELLAQCDLAKFARVVPAREDCLRLVDAAREFVKLEFPQPLAA